MMNLEQAERAYLHDPAFHAVVTAIEKWILEMHVTPAEARAAAMLACIRVEQMRPQRYMDALKEGR